MAPGDLQEVLEALKPAGRAHPDLLVGLAAADDAAVYRITSDFAIVETVDFFPPVVDDPWTWGAISAANSMSDVFAMGDRKSTRLNSSHGYISYAVFCLKKKQCRCRTTATCSSEP